MGGIIDDAIGGLNTFLEDQKKEDGECNITIAMFDSEYELPYDNVLLEKVEPFTRETYVPRGATALYDAIGKTVATIGERLVKTDESERPENVIVVVLTDGFENSSKEYSESQIFEMIKTQENEFNWEFVYLAAGQDAMKVGQSMGFKSNSTMDFASTGEGTRGVYALASAAVGSYRKTKVAMNLREDQEK